VDGYAVVDVETTGFSPACHDRVVDVAVVHVSVGGHIGETFSTLVNPERDLGTQSIHRVRAADARRAPTFADVAPHLAAQLRGRVMVAHNLRFDALFLAAEFQRAGVLAPIDREFGLCTMLLAPRLLGAHSRSLTACCDAVGVQHRDAHTALGDAVATAHLLAHYLRVTGQPPPWAQLYRHADASIWPDLPVHVPLIPAQRTSSADGSADGWLDRLVIRMPSVPEPPQADSYLAVLDRALIDRHLSEVEKDALVALAADLDLTRPQVLELHRNYLTALAALAWADGVVTETEHVELVAIAAGLGLNTKDVDDALEQARHAEPSDGLGSFALKAGDSVTFTGEMSIPREEWAQRAQRYGLAVSLTSVTKKTAVLVAADPDSMSGKARRAAQYGVPVISEEAFVLLCEQLRR
jgi:DNA polymerase III subunit epsilon